MHVKQHPKYALMYWTPFMDTLCHLGILHAFLLAADFFNINFLIIISGIPSVSNTMDPLSKVIKLS